MLILAAELSDYGKPMEEALVRYYKINKKMGQNDKEKFVVDLMKAAGDTDPHVKKLLLKEVDDNAPAFGIRIVPGHYASRELRFASTDQALQHLSNVTGKRVKVARISESNHKRLVETVLDLIDRAVDLTGGQYLDAYEALGKKVMGDEIGIDATVDEQAAAVLEALKKAVRERE
jgi:hypothetical protein